MLRYDIVRADPTHHPMIYSSYLHGVRAVIDENLVPSGRLFAAQHSRAEAWLAVDAPCSVLVAVAADDADAVIGWACAELPATLNYVYTKRLYRRQGVARALVNALLYANPERTPAIVEFGSIGPGAAHVVRMLAAVGVAGAVRVVDAVVPLLAGR